jgi:hypothetical protein
MKVIIELHIEHGIVADGDLWNVDEVEAIEDTITDACGMPDMEDAILEAIGAGTGYDMNSISITDVRVVR